MADKLIPLALPPGYAGNGTKYQAKGRWYDGSLVRFFSGTIQPIGGWQRLVDDGGGNMAALSGMPRASIGWRLTDESPVVAFFTLSNLYCHLAGVKTDITPAGFTTGRADTVASSSSSGSGNYGDGSYNVGLYGSGALTGTELECDVETLDVFGTYLVAISTADHILYVWDGNPADVAVAAGSAVSAWSGATTYQIGDQVSESAVYYQSLTAANLNNDPATNADQWAVIPAPGLAPHGSAVFCTPERFVVVLGAEDRNPDGTLSGNLNGRLAAWASQESYTDWIPAVTNTAGDFPLTTQGRLICGAAGRNVSLIWSDCDVWTMTFTGDQFVYAFAKVGDKCGIIAPNAKVLIDTKAYWMGKQDFFVYDGFTSPIPCDVRDRVFGDFNAIQSRKVWAMTIATFGEIWWFYPSANSQECDKYVVYNYREDHWVTGSLQRNTGFDAGAIGLPIMVDSAGLAYTHETLDDMSGAGLPALESGPVEISDGDNLVSVSRLVPDEKNLGDVQGYIYSALYPTDTEAQHGPFSMATPSSIRFKGRWVRLKLEQVNATSWRVGVMRLGIKPSSRR